MMANVGVRCVNDVYVTSPSAILKSAELVLGAGAWGSQLIIPNPTSGAYVYFIWATLSSWMLVLLTYLFGVLRYSTRPRTEQELEKLNAPELGDLILNAIIAALYIPAIAVYSAFFINILGYTVSIFVVIVSTCTFFVHAFHASTLIVYYQLGSGKWVQDRRWIWEWMMGGTGNPKTTSLKYEDKHTKEQSSNDVVEERKPREESSDHQIYQDLS